MGTRLRVAVEVTIFAVAITVLVNVGPPVDGIPGWLWTVGVGWVSIKLLLALTYRPVAAATADRDQRVAAIVPVFNEDPVLFAECLHSVIGQTRRLEEIFVVDDGSTSTQCYEVAQRLLGSTSGATVHRQSSNRGKRHAQAWALRRTCADIIVTVDSDTVLDAHAVGELLKPFAASEVQAVTANVRALNHRRNLLTTLTGLRYATMFLYERTAYSALRSVLCCCGSLTAIRADVIHDNLADYTTQTFLGRHVSYGDDRRLTNYALARGRVVIQTTAVASTMVPERLGHFARQQIRWTKSFVRETLWALRNFKPNRAAWWLSLDELITWTVGTTALALTVLVANRVGPHQTLRLVVLVALVAYARTVRYLHDDATSTARAAADFLLAPLYGLLHLLVLVPLRYYTLGTLREGGWGTRQRVEVALSAPN